MWFRVWWHRLAEWAWYATSTRARRQSYFWTLCSAGRLAEAQAFVRQYRADVCAAQTLVQSLLVMVGAKQLPMAQWFVDEFGMSSDMFNDEKLPRDSEMLLRRACGTSSPDVVAWVATTFASVNTKRCGLPGAVRDVCERGDMAMMQCLAETFSLTQADMELWGALAVAVNHGHVNFVMWLIKEFHLMRDAMGSLCMQGQRKVAEWFVKECGLERDEARDVVPLAFGHGHAGMAEWLLSFHTWSAMELREMHAASFYVACRVNCLDRAKALATTFQLTDKEVRFLDNASLTESCEQGNTELVKWLVTTFDLTAEDAREGYAKACAVKQRGSDCTEDVLKWLEERYGWHVFWFQGCQDGHMHVVTLLADAHEPTADQVRKGYSLAYIFNCEDVTQYMQGRFPQLAV